MADVFAKLVAGRSSTPSGIYSSTANSSGGLNALGVAEAKDVLGLSGSATAMFSGQTVDATYVLVKYTYAGDANLDGRVTGDDYSCIDFAMRALSPEAVVAGARESIDCSARWQRISTGRLQIAPVTNQIVTVVVMLNAKSPAAL